MNVDNDDYNPTILFIKGVFIRDCIPMDDIFEKHIIEQLNIHNPVIYYDKLPSVFYTIETWVSQTNIKCWYCDLNFETQPVFIPKTIERSITNSIYSISTHGCFCSFYCATSYCNLYYNKICDNIKMNEMIRFLYKIFKGKRVREILTSPSKYEMVQYGGNIDNIEYRRKINELNARQIELEFLN